jgi:hypothetical protein
MKKNYKPQIETVVADDSTLLSNSRLLELQSVLETSGVLSLAENDSIDTKFWENLEKRYPTYYVEAFKSLYMSNIKFDSNCFSKDAVNSNIWLLEELKKIKMPMGVIFLCSGWYATLAVMMFEHKINFIKIRSFDLDPHTATVAELFNRPWVIDEWKFKSVISNNTKIDFDSHNYDVLRSNGTVCNLTDSPDTVINVNCEFTTDATRWFNDILSGMLVIVQGSDSNTENQPNVYKNLREFDLAFPINNVLYCDEKKLENCTKYMKIGFK